MRALCCCSLVAIWLVTVAPGDQNPLEHPVHPVGEYVPWPLDSGSQDNPGQRSATVFARVVEVPEAAWLRLYFSTATLGPGSFVRMTSLQDGESQRLDAAGLNLWSNTSAYFNGPAVLLELIAGPGTVGNRVVLEQVAMEPALLPRGDPGQCGICGSDDRTPSNEDWSGRILPVGCTGSVYTTSSCIVSAGHCASGASVIQFRVPPSNANCSLNHPPVDDQFPIVTRLFSNGGLGNDWMVATTGPNGLGQKAFQRYGKLRRADPVVGFTGQAVQVFGFGVDSTCVRSQTQQLSTGAITGGSTGYYTFNADVRGGNSGSGLLRSGKIIGIVTHCSVGCPNFATRVTLGAFAEARNNLCPPCPADLTGDGTVGQDDLGVLLAAFGSCAGDPNYNNVADLDLDDCVGQSDLGILLADFGRNCP